MPKNPFATGIFSSPQYSAFPWSHGNRISMDAGKIHVIASEYLDTGEKFDLNSMGNVTRVAPMLAPTLDTYQTDIHAFAVRLRSIGMATRNPWTYEDFFNLNENLDGSKRLPDIPLALLIGINKCKNNTLLENFGLPTFKNLREDYLSYLRRICPFVFDTVVKVDVSKFDDTRYIIGIYPSSLTSNHSDLYYRFNNVDYYYSYEGVSYSFTTSVLKYVLSNFSSTFQDLVSEYLGEDYNLDSFDFTPEAAVFVFTPEHSIDEEIKIYNLADLLYERLKIDAVTLINIVEDALLDGLWSLSSNGNIAHSATQIFSECVGFNQTSIGASIVSSLRSQFPDLPYMSISWSSISSSYGIFDSPLIPTYFFDAYYKICSDWFINTALFEPDSWYINKVKLFHPRAYNGEEVDWSTLFGSSSSSEQAGYIQVVRDYEETSGFVHRYWRNDYFTSCFPSPQAGNAVGIPVNGTIVDLRNANSMQKLKERLLYAGKRFRDVLYSLTGKRTSSAILDMSEVLGAWSNTINVDSVLQQSASENGQPLANYAGTALGYRSGGKGCFYIAEEPTVIIFVASIRPRASYYQGFHRKFTRSNVYDYDLAQLSNVGEEVVRLSELYVDGDSTSASGDYTIFGFQRRFGSFMWTPDEVHGDFRGSLDYWHNARTFGSRPALNSAFLEVRPDEDNLNRIFAVTSDAVNHFYAHFTFVGNVIRHLPKHVVYDL